MEFKKLLGALLACGLALTPNLSFAEEDELAKEEIALEESGKQADFTNRLKEKYSLTDEQIKAMQDKGLTNPQMAMAAQLSQTSGKPLDDVLKMRTEDKMGWGKIAKELGVHPGEIGKSVSSMRHDLNEKRKEDRQLAKENRKELRKQRKEQRRELREQRKSEKRKNKS